jgi:hypothetical protein
VNGFQPDGTYTLDFSAVQRLGNNQDISVLVDGVQAGMVTPAAHDQNYQQFSIALPRLSGGAHTITFAGLNTAGGDNTATIGSAPTRSAQAARKTRQRLRRRLLITSTYRTLRHPA